MSARLCSEKRGNEGVGVRKVRCQRVHPTSKGGLAFPGATFFKTAKSNWKKEIVYYPGRVKRRVLLGGGNSDENDGGSYSHYAKPTKDL